MARCGTRSAYMDGCDCNECRRAEREYRQAYRARTRTTELRRHVHWQPCPRCGHTVGIVGEHLKYCEPE